jgi:pimeloyl-ACP methyl ester carboxylesterase/class 3 adenylate cyclase
VTRYAYAGDVAIAYRVTGEGSLPVVFVLPMSNVEVLGEEPFAAYFLRRLGAFSRLITYDKRGTGLSDRKVDAPTLEERAEDLLAVLDAEGIERAALFGVSEGGSLAAYVAATHPDRVTAIVVWGTPSRIVRDEAHPWGLASPEQTERFISAIVDHWGDDVGVAQGVRIYAPSMVGDDRFAASLDRWRRHSISRDAFAAHVWSQAEYDLADVFRTVRVPTLILHRVDDALVPVAQGRRLAEVMPEAQYVELPGADHIPFLGDADAVLAEIELFLTGQRSAWPGERRLLTLLVTDIAESTAIAEALGDGPWGALLASFDDAARQCIARFDGREIKQTGDGFLVAFDGPARAIQCAMAIADAAERVGVEVRTGIHTGECELRGDDVAGIAVHVAARLAEAATVGRVVASATVRDLVAGAGIRFGDRVEMELPGVAGPRTVHEVLRRGATPAAVRQLVATRTSQLAHEGEYWTVAFGGRVATLRDSAGIADLSTLLERPGREIHVLDLSASDGSVGLAPGSPTGVLDAQARTTYRQRLEDLEDEIDEATGNHDDERAARLEAERDQLVGELASAYGLGERDRTFAEEGERARKAVTKRIRAALDRIDAAHPALGRHLQATIRTGMYCAYEPDPVVHWDISR